MAAGWRGDRQRRQQLLASCLGIAPGIAGTTTVSGTERDANGLWGAQGISSPLSEIAHRKRGNWAGTIASASLWIRRVSRARWPIARAAFSNESVTHFPAKRSKRVARCLRCEGFEATFANITTASIEAVNTRRLRLCHPERRWSRKSPANRRGSSTSNGRATPGGPSIRWAGASCRLGVDHASFHGHGCEKLGYAPYGRKNQAKYGSPAPWADRNARPAPRWGFNLLSVLDGTAPSRPGPHGVSGDRLRDGRHGRRDEHHARSRSARFGLPQRVPSRLRGLLPLSGQSGLSVARERPLAVRVFPRQRVGLVGTASGSRHRPVRRRDDQVGRPHGQAGSAISWPNATTTI